MAYLMQCGTSLYPIQSKIASENSAAYMKNGWALSFGSCYLDLVFGLVLTVFIFPLNFLPSTNALLCKPSIELSSNEWRMQTTSKRLINFILF